MHNSQQLSPLVSKSHSFLDGSSPPGTPPPLPWLVLVTRGQSLREGSRGLIKPQIHAGTTLHHTGYVMIHFLASACKEENTRRQKLAENGLWTILSRVGGGPSLNARPGQVPKIQLLPAPSPLLLQKGWDGWNAHYTVMLVCWSCDNYQAIARGKGLCSGWGADKKRDFPTTQMTGCWGLTFQWRMEGEANRLVCVLLAVLQAPCVVVLAMHHACVSSRAGLRQLPPEWTTGGRALLPTAAGKGGSGK